MQLSGVSWRQDGARLQHQCVISKPLNGLERAG